MSAGGQGLIVSTLPSGMLKPDGTIDVSSLQLLLNDLRNGLITVWASGVTAARPINPILSQLYYDTQTVQYLYCSAVRAGATAAVWTAFGSGGGGSGTVTSIDADAPITVTPDPITATGTISHDNTAVTPGSYTTANITVDQKGHVTAAANGTVTIPAGTGLSWLWGSGLDGNVNFNGTNTFAFAVKTGSVYVVTRILHCTDCTIAAGVTVMFWDYASPGTGGGAQIYCTGTFTCSGHLSGDGQNNLFNTDQGGQGTPSGVNCIYLYGADGGAGASGANGAAGSSRADGFGGNGGAGGASITPRTGGAGGTTTYSDGPTLGGYYQLYTAYAFQSGVIRGLAAIYRQFGGGSGGGAGGGVTTGAHKGGGGGGGGQVIAVFAKFIAGSGSITANGSQGNIPPTSTDAGGGGGGGGGVVITITTTTSIPCTVTAAGGAGRASGGAGGTGVNGTAGKVISITVS